MSAPLTSAPIVFAVFAAALLMLPGCAQEAPPSESPPGVLITTAPAERGAIEVVERSVGRLESKAKPLVAAEIAGQVHRVEVEVGHAVVAGALLALIEPEDYRSRVASARAEIGRLEAQVEQQERLVTRYQKLARRDFFATNSLEEAQAQLKVFSRQLDAARSALEEAQRDLARTEVRAPVAGRIESRLVDAGDYVKAGTGMFRISTDHALRAVLPFPERIAGHLAVGQRVRLTSPMDPERRLETRITDLRPTVGAANRAVEALVDFANPGTWRAGASVDGEVVIEQRSDSVTVPEAAVVLRPAGATVYVVDGEQVRARLVRVGQQEGGRVEILEGLAGGETVALDGAGFLTDGARVRFQEPRS